MDGAEKENGEETDWEEEIIAAKEADKNQRQQWSPCGPKKPLGI